MKHPVSPRSLGDDKNIALRLQFLKLPHIAPLTKYVSDLRRRSPEVEYPYFDPFDGGVKADILFLFEKPGPRTSAHAGGSGFISRDNDDPSAEATFRFMAEAQIPRSRTVTWNVIPGWNGTRKITRHEITHGVAETEKLIKLLPRLKTIVCVGRKSGAGFINLRCRNV